MVRVTCSHAKHPIHYLERKWLSLAMTVSALMFACFRIILKSFFFFQWRLDRQDCNILLFQSFRQPGIT